MRHLVLTDLHSNWEALQAVLRDCERQYDEVWCLGDIVGYGADPQLVVDWIRDNAVCVIRGNHDHAVSDPSVAAWFHERAAFAVRWTREVLSDENRRYLSELPAGPLQAADAQLVHGSPLGEDEYLDAAFDLLPQLPYLSPQIFFFGHTHKQGGFLYRRNSKEPVAHPQAAAGDLQPEGTGYISVLRIPPVPVFTPRATLRLREDVGYLLNPGSVGQPRDQDPRAAYLIYDSSERSVEYRRVAYDIAQAQNKIRAAGLREEMAARLEVGL